MCTIVPVKPQSDEVVPVPDGWDRCHAYLPRKRRFCRQITVLPKYNLDNDLQHGTARYCGNHLELYNHNSTSTHTSSERQDSGPKGVVSLCRGLRIPCPIDPSHTIYEHSLAKHIKNCPRTKQRQAEISKPYYIKNINCGGLGDITHHHHDSLGDNKNEVDMETFACTVLEVYQSIFMPSISTTARQIKSNNKTITMTHPITEEMYNVISLQDLSADEIHRGLKTSLDHYKIRSGGPKHIAQQGSIVGHLRKRGLLPSTGNCSDSRSETTDQKKRVVLEVGAGRGMLGLVAAGVTSSELHDNQQQHSGSNDVITNAETSNDKTGVTFIMVERSGSKGKADVKIRTAAAGRSSRQNVPQKYAVEGMKKDKMKESQNNLMMPGERPITELDPSNETTTNGISKKSEDYLKIDTLDMHRIKCDLANVYLPAVWKDIFPNAPLHSNSALTSETPASMVVVAKHLCGCGTDLALKSLAVMVDEAATPTNVDGPRSAKRIADNSIEGRSLMKIEGCVFATCCHGVCNWDDYVGRDSLSKVFNDMFAKQNSKRDEIIQRDGGFSNSNTVFSTLFSREHFELMCRLATGTVYVDKKKEDVANTNKNQTDVQQQHMQDSHGKGTNRNNEHSVKKIVDIIRKTHNPLLVNAGVVGLGRSCQRLIDYGRQQYMQNVLGFPQTDMVHYVDTDVTPQNALLIGSRKINKT